MNNIKDSFFIQDLEIYSGVKAHTIRIWEKRYDLLNPTRLNRNIRKYSLLDLQKLLNVSLLYSNGYKISKISKLTEEELQEECRSLSAETIQKNYFVNKLIVCMYGFDTLVFEEIYVELSATMSFDKIFTDVYIPMLNHIGLLWQTDAIQPVHEHFISSLITQKILLNTSLISGIPNSDNDEVFVLFLPEGEIHEIGLMFLNLVLKKQGFKTVYLGSSLPIDNIEFVINKFSKVSLICAFMIDKTPEEKTTFIETVKKLVVKPDHKIQIVGSIWDGYELDSSYKNSILFTNDFRDLKF